MKIPHILIFFLFFETLGGGCPPCPPWCRPCRDWLPYEINIILSRITSQHRQHGTIKLISVLLKLILSLLGAFYHHIFGSRRISFTLSSLVNVNFFTAYLLFLRLFLDYPLRPFRSHFPKVTRPNLCFIFLILLSLPPDRRMTQKQKYSYIHKCWTCQHTKIYFKSSTLPIILDNSNQKNIEFMSSKKECKLLNFVMPWKKLQSKLFQIKYLKKN